MAHTMKFPAALLAATLCSTPALSNQHPHPHKGSLDYLDRNSYAKNMRVLGVFQLGEERGHKLQMMAVGSRRYILQNGDVIDVSDPRAPKLVKHAAFRGSQLQVAYNRKLGKWILVTGASSPITSSTPTAPNGKHDDPSLIEKTKQGPGLRGIRIWDATDPANIVLLSEFATDSAMSRRARGRTATTTTAETTPTSTPRPTTASSTWRARSAGTRTASWSSTSPIPRVRSRPRCGGCRDSASARRSSTSPGASTATGYRSPACTGRCTFRRRSKTAASSATAHTARSAC